MDKNSRILDWTPFGGEGNLPKTGTWRHVEPFYEDWTPPCNNVCLASEDIVKRLEFLEDGKIPEAIFSLWQANPFPSLTGRVCPHPCEKPCNRKALGGAVSIRDIERFLGDYAAKNDLTAPLIDKKNDFPVAVIGSGPGGLAASYFLNRLGHPVTIFEKEEFLGGLLRSGIPSYRLPNSILDIEIERLRRLGIKFVLGKHFGRNLELGDLESDFKAIVIAPGLTRSQKLNIPGEDLPGVLDGVRWLKDLNCGERPVVKDVVAVIGGGNTALDCARCSLRLGAHPVIVYRRTKAQMPAFSEEIQEAQEEGVEFKFLSAPVYIKALSDGKLELTIQEMKLGEPDASGRPKPVPIEGAFQKIEVSYVFKALGEKLNASDFSNAKMENGRLAQQHTFESASLKIFACGDAAGASTTVAQAIRTARETAFRLHSALCQYEIPELHLTKRRGANPEIAKFKHFNTSYFSLLKRTEQKIRAASERSKDFFETHIGLTQEEIFHEAKRCFKCGTCTLCGNCEVFCPDSSIHLNGSRYTVDYDYCKGCGICVEECPRGAIHMKIRV